MRFLRTNTAVIVTVGPFYDKTDGVTIETALTITNERITLTADTDDGSAPTNILDNVTGATSGTSNDLNYITGNDAGMMQLELSAANTNRLGRMMLAITDAANHVPVFHEFMVVPALVYDTYFAASGGATFPAATLASTTNITAGTITTTTNLTNLPAITANWLTAAGIASGALNGKGDWNIGKTGYALSSAGIQAIWDALTSALTTVGSIGKLLVDNINATISSRLAPTTAGRTLDVTATGAAGLDWGNIENPTTVVNLSQTSALAVTSVTNVLGTVYVGGYKENSGAAEAIFQAGEIPAAAQGTTSFISALPIQYDGQYLGWIVIIEHGDSGIAFASAVVNTVASTETFHLADAIPNVSYVDPIPFLLMPMPAMYPQRTRDAMKLAPTAGSPTAGSVDAHLDNIEEDTGTTLPAQITALNNLSAAQVNAEVVDVLRTDTIPDSYAADGAQPTIAQAILAIQQFLMEKSVSSTTVTVKKPDGSTTAMTFTLDSASSPTSITRS